MEWRDDDDDDGWVGFEGFEGCGGMWGGDFEEQRCVGERDGIRYNHANLSYCGPSNLN